jgi:hypothetical protein
MYNNGISIAPYLTSLTDNMYRHNLCMLIVDFSMLIKDIKYKTLNLSDLYKFMLHLN